MYKLTKQMLLFLCRGIGLFAFSRRLTRSNLRILAYHGGSIGDEHKYNPMLFMSASHFGRRMAWLKKKRFSVLSLDDAMSGQFASVDQHNLPTVITFDDGWFSTATELVPVIEYYQYPFTLYLCTSHLTPNIAVPIVLVRYIIWKSPCETASFNYCNPHLDGDYDLTNPAERELLAYNAGKWLTDLMDDETCFRESVYNFSTILNVDNDELGLETKRFEYMSADMIKQCAIVGGTIELHGHIHNYPVNQPDVLKEDLKICSRNIQDMGLPKPKHYCYPSGVFDGNNQAFEELGIVSATTCKPGLVDHIDHNNQYLLPRFLDANEISQIEFEAELSGFMEYLRKLLRKTMRETGPGA